MDDRAPEVFLDTYFSDSKAVESTKAVQTSPQRSTSHNKSPRKKHSTVVTNKWSKQNGRDEFSSNEDLATCSGGK